ncbi:hypothetical protein AAHA92_00006 [Salvia divinorum]|uniref:PB1 domain-containing protein n=1 Tax=Salvia divinorum TaxID=28513 RepID=A0ABD1II34_SALDI
MSTITQSTAAHSPDSSASSPLFRKHNSWDADPPPPQPQAAKLRLMCSYGGRIVPRPHDKTLCYAGGDTRIIVIDRHTSLEALHRRLSKTLLSNQPFSLKYQLPTEDLDSLITITSDEDLENMMEEYDRLHNAAPAAKTGRLRLFMFPKSPTSIDQLLAQTTSSKPEDWFLNALNGKSSNQSTAASDRGFSDSSSVINLLGLDDDFAEKAAEKDAELKIEAPKFGGNSNGVTNGNCVINQDVHSIPDSPMLDTTSSFGSASSSPSVPNLPRIKVHVEENRKVGGLGIEEQFQQISVNPPSQKQEQEAFTVVGVAAGTTTSPFPVVAGGEYRFVSDDERSDHGGQRKAQQISHFQQKQTNACDPSSPHSVSSDGSGSNQLHRQRQAIYHQEQPIQIQSGNSRAPSNHADFNSVDQANAQIQMQPQLQESGYQIQPELHQPQQFIHAGNNYIPSNAAPITSYYPVYSSQPQPHPPRPVLDQHYPVYYVPGTARPTPTYNLPMQQPGYSELGQTAPSSHPQTAPVAPQAAYNHARNMTSSQPEMVSGLYITGATAAPQTVQVPASQPQYVAFTPILHSSSAANQNYAYELFDPTHAQMYYTRLPPQMAAQFQTFNPVPSMAANDASASHSAETIHHGSG